MGGRGPGAAACTGAGTGAAAPAGTHADRGAAGVAGRARRGVHRVLGRGRSRRCRLVGVLETGAARGAKPRAAAARHEAVVRALLLARARAACRASPPSRRSPAEPAAPRSWQSLSPQQQQLLHSFQGNWDSLPAEKQQALARGSDRWIHMTPEERSGAQERFKTVACAAARAAAAAARALAAVQGAAPGAAAAHSRAVSALSGRCRLEQRRRCVRQWRQMTPEQRQWRTCSLSGAAVRCSGAMPQRAAHPPRGWPASGRAGDLRRYASRRWLRPRRARSGSGTAC